MPRKTTTLKSICTSDNIVEVLADRFQQNMSRHSKLKWKDVESRLLSQISLLSVLIEMEKTEGEPDVIHYDRKQDSFLFVDCSPESPKGRRSLCYDRTALLSRKENRPLNSAMDLAKSIGCEMLTEQEYRLLQQVGEFDLKSSSWVQTPSDIRSLGGALFCDRRFGHVFVYHNGAQSYFIDRGFRGVLRV